MSVDAGRKRCREGHDYPGWWQAECPVEPQDNDRLKALARVIGKLDMRERAQFLSRASVPGYVASLCDETAVVTKLCDETPKVGRPKKYDSRAEQQRAYRGRHG